MLSTLLCFFFPRLLQDYLDGKFLLWLTSRNGFICCKRQTFYCQFKVHILLLVIATLIKPILQNGDFDCGDFKCLSMGGDMLIILCTCFVVQRNKINNSSMQSWEQKIIRSVEMPKTGNKHKKVCHYSTKYRKMHIQVCQVT